MRYNACCESFACDKRPEYAPKLDHAPEASGLIEVCRLRGIDRQSTSERHKVHSSLRERKCLHDERGLPFAGRYAQRGATAIRDASLEANPRSYPSTRLRTRA